MPYYDYYCAANDRTLEVRHSMSDTLRTWGELCDRAGVASGDTPPDAPVERILSAPATLTGGRTSESVSDSPAAPCGPSCGCAWD